MESVVNILRSISIFAESFGQLFNWGFAFELFGTTYFFSIYGLLTPSLLIAALTMKLLKLLPFA